jgi:D-sedoheptulose 7-phosphate isomerase
VHREALDRLDALASEFEKAAELVCQAYLAGNKLLLCGNGGSASDCLHIAGELVGRFLLERRPLSAIVLGANLSTLSAVANDYSWQETFEREVAAFGRAGDVLIAVSTSGNSPSIVAAAAKARELGIKVIGMAGRGGGKLAPLSDACLCVDAPTTARVQEMHILLGHALCEVVEATVCRS